MRLQISNTKKIKVKDSRGACYSLTFKIPTQSRIRAIRKVCVGHNGNLNSDALAVQISKETLEMLVDVEGVEVGFDDNHENDFTVCSTMSEENIRKVKEFYEQNGMEYFKDASGWKATFISLFPKVFECAELMLWKNDVEPDETEGK